MSSLQRQIIEDLGTQPAVDPETEIERRVAFLADYLVATHAKGYVLGISGGQDSSLAGRLTQMAVERVRETTGRAVTFIALRLPYGVQRDEDDAQRALGFIKADKVLTVNVKEAVDASANAFREATGEELTHYVKGNTKARERMKVHYDFAGQHGVLVVGTDHGAEALVGFFTKFGDGGCDVLPISGLTKRQGKQLLQALGADPAIYEKVPTADLRDDVPGQPDEVELGLTYEQIDDYLEGKSVEPDVAARLEARYLATRHKRTVPVTPSDTWWKSS